MILRFIMLKLQKRLHKRQQEVIRLRWQKAELEKVLDQKKRAAE